jgi:hypothetical protein
VFVTVTFPLFIRRLLDNSVVILVASVAHVALVICPVVRRSLSIHQNRGFNAPNKLNGLLPAIRTGCTCPHEKPGKNEIEADGDGYTKDDDKPVFHALIVPPTALSLGVAFRIKGADGNLDAKPASMYAAHR